MIHYLTYFLIAAVVCFILHFPFRKTALLCHITTLPRETLPQRKQEIPLLGGASLYFAFVLCLFLFFLWQQRHPDFYIVFQQGEFLSILIGAALVTFAGMIFDIYESSLLIRLALQCIVGFLVVVARESTPFVVSWHFSLEGRVFFVDHFLFTILWTLALINALELLDVVDGLLAGTALVLTSFLFLLAILHEIPHYALLSSILLGCLVGCWGTQVAPRRLVLGRMGGWFLGFCFAAITSQPKFATFVLDSSLLFLFPILLGLMLSVQIGRRTLQETWQALYLKKRTIAEFSFLVFTTLSVVGLLMVLRVVVSSSLASNLLRVLAVVVAAVGLFFALSQRGKPKHSRKE